MDKKTDLTARNFPTAKQDATDRAAPLTRYEGPESSFPRRARVVSHWLSRLRL